MADSATLGKAYVQIIPSAQGLTGSISKIIDPESERAGRSGGSKIGSLIKGAIATAGIGAAITKVVNEGAKLQQSTGGIETLFKDSADKVKQYASEAFKTVGVSANEYMENVTSFSASLLQSVGNDTDKAADIANMAMIDMSDNANKMGTDMQSIQNAYQGFAKENYTMLDNLKLGYGGTKQEMERLLADATKLTGVKYDISSLSDVYTAIHEIQNNLSITGTTALEANTTISGSFASMKAAFNDFLGSLTTGENVGTAMENLGQSISTFVFDNLIPMIGEIITNLPEAIGGFFDGILSSFSDNGLSMITSVGEGITQGIPDAISQFGEFVKGLLDKVGESLPNIIEKGTEFISSMIEGLSTGIPQAIETMGEIIAKLLEVIMQNLPQIIESGLNLVMKLAEGIIKGLPNILTSMIELITKLIGTISQNMPKFVEKGLEIIAKLIIGLVKAVPDILASIGKITVEILKGFGQIVVGIVDVGKNIIKGLWEGIKNMVSWIMDKVKGFIGGIVNAAKSVLGIKSPSKVFADIGKFVDLGLAEGISNNLKPVTNAMDELQAETNRDFAMRANFRVSTNKDQFKKDTTTQPIQLNLNIGGQSFKAFVDNISQEQNKQISLEMAY